ncbi:MAG: hypothetical protein HC869_00555 [Rhodospirillales bacterium]|nr:hypothetical protein [Rhodospirillales bacterium]
MKAKMVRPGSAITSQDSQLAIAVFDDWPTLQAVIDDLCGSCGSCPSAIVLSRDMPDIPEKLNLAADVTHIRFASGLYATCSRGRVADELATRLSHRPHTLAHALHDWLPLDQSWKLESHIEQGQLVLMLELRSHDDHEALCAILVRHSPHIIRLLEFNVHVSRR